MKTLKNYTQHNNVNLFSRKYAYLNILRKFQKTGNEHFRKIITFENGVVTLDDIAQEIALQLYRFSDDVFIIDNDITTEKHDDDNKTHYIVYEKANRLEKLAEQEQTQIKYIKQLQKTTVKNSKQYKEYQTEINKHELKKRHNIKALENELEFFDYIETNPIEIIIPVHVHKGINYAINHLLRVEKSNIKKDDNSDLLTMPIVTDFTGVDVDFLLNSLNDELKTIATMLYNGLKITEIAKALNKPQPIITYKVKEIRRILSKKLNE